jgi:hypothetical protein
MPGIRKAGRMICPAAPVLLPEAPGGVLLLLAMVCP